MNPVRLVQLQLAANAFEELIRSGRTRLLADRSHATRKPEDYQPKAKVAPVPPLPFCATWASVPLPNWKMP